MTEYKAKFTCDRCEFHGKDNHALKTHEKSKKHTNMLNGIVKKVKPVKEKLFKQDNSQCFLRKK